MSTKDTPEEVNEVNEDAEVKPAAKKTVRKTIRRVRKVAPKRDKEEAPADPSAEGASGDDAAAPAAAGSENASEADTADRGDADAAPPKKRVPKSNQRGTPRKDVRSDSGSDDDSGRSEGRDRRGGERRSGRQRRGGTAARRVLEPVSEKELSKKAWKIYQADIAEEGIALVDDKTGRNLALRSFELARMFLEEEAKQKRSMAAAKSELREKGPKDDDRKSQDEAPKEEND